MPLEHAFSRFGLQDNRSYGKESDTVGLEARLGRYRKSGKAYSVIRSYFFWLDVMSRQDRKAWIKRAAQVRAMIIDAHGGPGDYIKNMDKSGMIRIINYHLDKEEARYIMSGSRYTAAGVSIGKRKHNTSYSSSVKRKRY